MSYEMIVDSVKTLTYDEQINLMSVLVNALKTHTQAMNNSADFSDEYPDGFFDLFGSNPDFSLTLPEELSWDDDFKREVF